MLTLANPRGATLGGKVSVQAVNGVAIFSNLMLDQPSTGYMIQVTSNGFPAQMTSPINVEGTVQEPPAVLQFGSTQFAANVTDGSTQIVLTRAGNLAATVTVVVSSS